MLRHDALAGLALPKSDGRQNNRFPPAEPYGCEQIVKLAYRDGQRGFRDSEQCPWPNSDLKRRCAWMAGYYDEMNCGRKR